MEFALNIHWRCISVIDFLPVGQKIHFYGILGRAYNLDICAGFWSACPIPLSTSRRLNSTRSKNSYRSADVIKWANVTGQHWIMWKLFRNKPSYCAWGKKLLASSFASLLLLLFDTHKAMTWLYSLACVASFCGSTVRRNIVNVIKSTSDHSTIPRA